VNASIVIFGVTGSGKTTLAKCLAETLGLGVIELDALRHATGWESVDWPEMRTALEREIERFTNGWVCEGNYSRVADIALSRVDTVIWLNLPWRITFCRLFLRSLRRGITRQKLYTDRGPRESAFTTFATKHSILWWSIHHHHATKRSIQKLIKTVAPFVRIVELRSPSETKSFIQSVTAGSQEARLEG
jgi:adenylate kinase family enzyme